MHAAHRDTSAACHILGGVLLALLHLSVVLCDAHGSHINICAADERPVSAAAKRISCKQDPKCIHETQCGCIPKHCTCGNEACIFAGEDKDHAHADADADADAAHVHTDDGKRHSHAGGDSPHHHVADGSIIPDETTRATAAAGTLSAATGTLATGILAKAESGASKHHLVEEDDSEGPAHTHADGTMHGHPGGDLPHHHDDSEGPAHTHADGKMHGHPGGDLPHYHDSTGGLVFDLPKQAAKLVMNKGRPLLKPPPQTIPNASAVVATVGESSSKTNSNSTGTSESPESTQIHQVSV